MIESPKSGNLFADDGLIAISALQHYAFCPRQCVLIHREQQWAENLHTAEGRLLHERVHERQSELRGDILTCRGLRLSSHRVGLTGQADVVEFHRTADEDGCRLPGRNGKWRPVPVEYKRGRPKRDNCDSIQLCAQTLCLEEMLCVSIQTGFLFYGKSKRRCEVTLDNSLRQATFKVVEKLRAALCCDSVPKPVNDERCQACSLMEICVPQVDRAGAYLAEAIRQSLAI